MEIALFVLGLLFGGLISWVIAQSYYKKSSNELKNQLDEQRRIISKLPADVREIILEDKREQLTVVQLNELLQNKTFESDLGDPLAYRKCPRCGSENIERSTDVEVDYGPEGPESCIPYDIIKCKDCGWTKTEHGYESPTDWT